MDLTAHELAPVVVAGATGYVGSHLVSALRRQGREVRCIVRPGSNRLDLDFLASTGAEIIVAELHDRSDGLRKAFTGAAVAVHLIGSIAPRRGEKLEDLHGGQTSHLIRLCQGQDMKLVLVTALGTNERAASRYHTSKWAAEESLKSSQLRYVILRPSLILGRQDGRRDSKLVRRYCELLQTRKAVPLIAGGRGRVQPLFIGDLVGVLLSVIGSPDWDKQTLELGGPEIISMRRFLEGLMDTLDIHKPIMMLPTPVARVAAFFSQILQPVPLLTQDQVTLSLEDNICRHNALPAVLGRQPVSWQEALGTYRSIAPDVVMANGR